MNLLGMAILIHSESTKNLESRRGEIIDDLVKRGVEPDEIVELAGIITETSLRLYKDNDSE